LTNCFLNWTNQADSFICIVTYYSQVDQPSLVLPRDILLNEDGAYDTILAAYKEYIVEVAGVLAAAGGENPDATALAAQADEIIAFETSLARICSKDEDRSDTTRMYNPFKIQAYQEITDEFANLEILGVSSQINVPT